MSNHNIYGAAAPKPGDHYQTRNTEEILCPRCGQIHKPGTVKITRIFGNMGYASEFNPDKDCPNDPLPPAPPPPKFTGTPEELQQRSDHAFGFDHKPYEF